MLGVFIWKSLIYRKRLFAWALFELLFPLLTHSIVFVIYYYYLGDLTEDNNLVEKETIRPRIEKKNVLAHYLEKLNFDIIYTPNSEEVELIAQEINQTLFNYKGADIKRFKPVDSEEEMLQIFLEDYGSSLSEKDQPASTSVFPYGIIFDISEGNLNYRLRPYKWETERVHSREQTPGPMDKSYSYFEEGFVILQMVINDAFLVTMKDFQNFSMTLQAFPYPSYLTNARLTEFASSLLPQVTIYGYFIAVLTLSKKVIEEKQSGSKELVKMIGASEFVLYLDHMLFGMMLFLFTTGIVAVFLTKLFGNRALIAYSNPFILWLFLFTFCTLQATFVLAVSSFFSSPALGQFATFSLDLVSYAVVRHFLDKVTSSYLTFLTMFSPGIGVDWGYKVITNVEVNGKGVDFASLFENSAGMDISLGVVLVFMILLGIIYSLVFFYVTAINPGPFGSPKKWYFIFLCGLKKKKRTFLAEPGGSVAAFENVSGLPVGIGVRGLTKAYSKTRVVNSIDIDFYKGLITVLLGHNGAGKTTLMSMLSGMIPRTAGEIYFEGQLVGKNSSSYRKNIGLCPQDNLLYNYLTVEEHLIFYGKLRGLKSKEIKASVGSILSTFGLLEKKNTQVRTLSGGMKRKLCLGISLVGDPKVLILDEPSSGLDPEFRREVWNTLLALRGDRTLLISTHFMEEADVLGDMIAILDHGVIKCYGSSLFLKNYYSTGYQLCVDSSPSKIQLITDLIKNSVSTTVKLKTKSVATYSISSNDNAKLVQVLKSLENNSEKLSINSMGLTWTTMEDVFLRAGEESYQFQEENLETSRLEERKRVKGLRLLVHWFIALFFKKLQWTLSSWSLVAFFFLFWPGLILTLTVYGCKTMLASTGTMPSLKLDLSAYGKTKVFASSIDSTPGQRFEALVKEAGSFLEIISDSMVGALIKEGERDISYYRQSVIVAEEFGIMPNVLYSTIGLHGPPIAINLMYNSYMPEGRIVTYNHPFYYEVPICSFLIVGGVTLSLALALEMAFLTSAIPFLKFVHNERTSGGRHLQYMTGLSPFCYWLNNFLFDYLISMSIMIVVIVFFLLDPLKIFRAHSQLCMLLAIVSLSLASFLLLAYLFSFLLKNFYNTVALFTFVLDVGLIIKFIMLVIEGMGILDPEGAIKTVNRAFLLIPSYSSFSAFFIFSAVCVFSRLCSDCMDSKIQSQCKNVDYYAYLSWDREKGGLYEELTALAVSSLLFLLFLIVAEFGLVAYLWNILANLFYGKVSYDSSSSDGDVKAEKERVKECAASRDCMINTALIADGLAKKYQRSRAAVNGVHFQVLLGDCFGLLGINGAGKSTTFKMLTGEIRPSAGDAAIFGKKLSKNRLDYLSRVGYCPQEDGVIPELTGLQMLMLYARLRGLSREEAKQSSDFWIKIMGIEEHRNKKSGRYSGGTRRKLSTAMALIGDPAVVFLDEPTSGVDPLARRKLWTVMARTKSLGQTVIITSHSMDECEAVCDRITIMARGQMKCLGTIRHLKTVYGQGYTVEIKLKSSLSTAGALLSLKDAFVKKFPNAVLKDEHAVLLNFHIPDRSQKWSQLFTTMEGIKSDQKIIEDYIVSETTLEQIFILFAKSANPGANVPRA